MLRLSSFSPFGLYMVSLIAGSCAGISMPPLSLFIMMPMGFLVFHHALSVHAGRLSLYHGVVFWHTLCLGMGYFTMNLWWIAKALTVDESQFRWLIPFAVLGIPCVLSCFWASSFWILSRIGIFNPLKNTPLQALVYAGGLWGAEQMRASFFTGFPWQNPVYILGGDIGAMQILPYTGFTIAGFLVLVWAFAPIIHMPTMRRMLISRCFLWGVIPILLMGVGRFMLPAQTGFHTDFPALLLMQPNIPQKMKNSVEERRTIFRTIETMIQQNAALEKDAVFILPETALPFMMDRDEGARLAMKNALSGHELITGQIRYNNANQWFNSIVHMDSQGVVTPIYDKSHLVPFGEYVPFEKILEKIGIEKIVPLPAAFSEGMPYQTVALSALPPFRPLICYEIIFPSLSENQPDSLIMSQWILNITNDGWFGESWGPYQHVLQARFRAAEQGLPVIRVANTGITAVIDSYGRIIQIIPLSQQGLIKTSLPLSASHHPAGVIIFVTIVVLWCFTFLMIRGNVEINKMFIFLKKKDKIAKNNLKTF